MPKILHRRHWVRPAGYEPRWQLFLQTSCRWCPPGNIVVD